MDSLFASAYDAIPTGYIEGHYQGRRYAIRKNVTEDKRRGNLVAEELGGADYISLDFYRLSSGNVKLKPCEMPAQKVIDFVLGVTWMAAKSPL